jgi:hypothetical protein
MSTHPLIPFAHWDWDAPYVAKVPEFEWHAAVMAARSKSGLVTARRGSMAHIDKGLAVTFPGGRAQFAGRFLCGGGSIDVVILRDAADQGGVCVKCEDVARGPFVYRCLDSGGRLIYIGSAASRIARFKSHETQSPWWPEVADIQVEYFPTIFQARAAERLAIVAESPLHNKQYKKPA